VAGISTGLPRGQKQRRFHARASGTGPPVVARPPNLAMVYQRSGAGNRHFCDLLAKIEDHINMILNLFFTGNAIQSCYGHLKSTGGRSINGIFRVYTVKNDRNRHENDVIRGPSLCFVSYVCTESAIFAPARLALIHLNFNPSACRHDCT